MEKVVCDYPIVKKYSSCKLSQKALTDEETNLITGCWFYAVYGGTTNVKNVMKCVYYLVLTWLDVYGYPEDVPLFIESVVLEARTILRKTAFDDTNGIFEFQEQILEYPINELLECIDTQQTDYEKEIQEIEKLFIDQCQWKDFPSYLKESLYNNYKLK